VASARAIRDDVEPSRIPAGSVLRARLPGPICGSDARTPLEEWTFAMPGAVDEARSWTWDESAS